MWTPPALGLTSTLRPRRLDIPSSGYRTTSIARKRGRPDRAIGRRDQQDVASSIAKLDGIESLQRLELAAHETVAGCGKRACAVRLSVARA